jgi:hypothetical protein
MATLEARLKNEMEHMSNIPVYFIGDNTLALCFMPMGRVFPRI